MLHQQAILLLPLAYLSAVLGVHARHGAVCPCCPLRYRLRVLRHPVAHRSSGHIEALSNLLPRDVDPEKFKQPMATWSS